MTLFNIRLAAVVLLLVAGAMSGCAQNPLQSAPGDKSATAQPSAELSPELLYKIMVAEIALQRGLPQMAVQTLLEVVRETGDPRIAERATRLALNSRMFNESLEAATLWLKADPQSVLARQAVAALLVDQGTLTEARAPLEQWLATDKANVGQNFMQLSQQLSRNSDKKAVLELLRGLARPYNNVADVRLAVAQAAWNAKEVDGALTESRAALNIKPDLELAALFHAQALQSRSNAEAITFLGDHLKRYPKAKDVRLTYARLLAGAKRQPEARQQFELLVQEAPNNPDLSMAVGLLALQTNDYDAAEKHFQGALAAGHKEPDAIWMFLGQIHEERKNYDEALKWYAGVSSGERYLSAQGRYASVLVKQGKLPEARKHLQSIKPRDEAQGIQLVQVEANLLRDAQAFTDAYNLLGKALEGAPDSVDLLYDQAMIAEKIDRVDVMERNLRKVIALQPDHAHSYNALGYSLADRNQRLPEARKLIEKALELSPQDGYIVDSLGWVMFRQGQMRDAVVQLRRAFEMRPEAEVGAHLGEVLWVDGKRDEARKIWSDFLKENPLNDTLQSTLKRLAPSLLPVVPMVPTGK
jgi:tetratricopeptide (TPR) repeat protein